MTNTNAQMVAAANARLPDNHTNSILASSNRSMWTDMLAREGQPNGVASLDAGGRAPITQSPYIVPRGTSGAALQDCLDEAASVGGVALLTETYTVTAPLVSRCSIEQHPGSVIRATAEMDAVLKIGEGDNKVISKQSVGLTIDANDLAQRCIWMRGYQHHILDKARLLNAPEHALHVGVEEAVYNSFEAIVTNILIERTQGEILAGSVGIYVDEEATDNIFEIGILKDAETGMVCTTDQNVFSHLHAWAHPDYGVMDVGYDDHGNLNTWSQCIIDIPQVYGFHLRASNARLFGNRVLNSGAGALDNVAIGMHFDVHDMTAFIVGNMFVGGASTRLAADFDLPGTDARSVYGNVSVNVVTQHPGAFIHTSPDGASQLAFYGSDTLVLRQINAPSYIINNAGSLVFGALGGNVFRITNGYIEFLTALKNAADDAAAAIAGVPVNCAYRNGSQLMVRVV